MPDRSEADRVRETAYREAAKAVDRWLAKFGEPTVGAVEAREGAVNRLRAEMGRVVDLNLDLIRNAFAFLGSADESDGSPLEYIELPSAMPGTVPSTIVWLHNYDEATRSGVRLVGTRLSSEGGAVIEADNWSFAPGVVDVPGHSGSPVLASVLIPTEASSETYLGSITAVGLDGPPLAVRLEVIPPGPVAHDSW